MKFPFKLTIIIVVSLLVVVGAFGLLNGWISVPKDEHPPCEQLPTVTEATEALANHQDLAKEIKELSDNIEIEVGKPCPDEYPDRGLVMVKYNSKSERDAIADLLERREGFGAPVHLVKR